MLKFKNSHTPDRSHSSGFTLIELMIVIAIVAILVTLAVPAYQVYAIRARVTECVASAAPIKLAITEYRTTMTGWPPNSAAASLTNSGNFSNFCDGFINYNPGRGSFQIDIDETAVGGLSGAVQPQLTPRQADGGAAIEWRCSRGATPASFTKYLPSTCRDA